MSLQSTKARTLIPFGFTLRRRPNIIIPDSSQELHSLSESNPQIWGSQQREVLGTLSLSCVSGFENHSSPA